MRKKLFLGVAINLFALSFYFPQEALAIPSYARQTGFACSTCHYQFAPLLNSFGRAFKEGGYTMTGGQNMLEGDGLSLPVVLNASFQTKIAYDKTNGSSVDTSGADKPGVTNRGKVDFPEDVSIFLGGRVGEHVGFFYEMSLLDGDANNRFSALRLPIVFDVQGIKLEAVPFNTDIDGVAFGYETLNTGAMRQPLLNPTSTAQGYLGTTGSDASSVDGPFNRSNAMGVALVAATPNWFVNYTPWRNAHGTGENHPYDVTTSLHYIRAAVTPQVAGWDLGAGFQLWLGRENHYDFEASKDTSNLSPTSDTSKAWAIDAQAQGKVGDMPLGLYASYASAAASDPADATNIYNPSTYKSKDALAFNAMLGVIPDKLLLQAGYRLGRNGDPNNDGKDADNLATLGITYVPMMNFIIALDQSWLSGDGRPSDYDSETKVMARILY